MCVRVYDYVYYVDFIIEVDIKLVIESEDCFYRKYEDFFLSFLKKKFIMIVK